MQRFSVLLLIVLLPMAGMVSGCSTLLFREKRSYIHYPIKSGDTLFEVARRFDVTVAELQEVNDINNPRALVIGQIVKVPYFGQDRTRRAGDASVRASIGGSTAAPRTPPGSRVNLGPAVQYIGKLMFPVTAKGSYTSSKFGERWGTFHEGIDIAGKEGTPIYAAHAGTVVYSGQGISGYGNLVVIRGEGLLTVYGHNRSNRVRVGESIRRGEHIADLGQSGKATGPHLHFETRVRNTAGKYAAVDPLVFYPR